MALLSPTAIFVALILLYVFSFILFAVVRIATGVSIQRIGYFSLRHIAYSPRDGIRISIRSLGFSAHRPSFAKPTYISVYLTEPIVTIDPNILTGERTHHPLVADGSGNLKQDEGDSFITPTQLEELAQSPQPLPNKSLVKTWKTLTRVKNWIKRLHRQIHWLAMVDIVMTNATLRIADAGDIQLAAFSIAVDTRRKMMERGRLFRHKKEASGDQCPAEWILSLRNLLFTIEGHEQTEILDNLGLNIHGLLLKGREGLRDVSVAIKAGRLYVPYDELFQFTRRMKRPEQGGVKGSDDAIVEEDEMSFGDIMQELDHPGSREESIVQAVADSREFFSSMLRGIQEIQLALSFFRVSKAIETSLLSRNLNLNVVTHEVGIDFHRMDPTRPAHRMYFKRDDIAHQALVAAISLSASLDDSSGQSDKFLYIPMATTTIRTTLPSKTVLPPEPKDTDDRNRNVFFANFVITSPAVDLEPMSLSRILGMIQAKRTRRPRRQRRDNDFLISRLLPRANIKLSVQEPVLRFVLPLPGKTSEYNLLVSSISSVSLDIESSHSAEEGIKYSLASVYRVSSHQLYYQTASGVKHRLLSTDSMEVKVHLNATPEVCVVASGSLNSFSIHFISGEVIRGVNQVVEHFRSPVEPTKLSTPANQDTRNILRRLPPWLLQFQFETSGFSIEVGGIDETVGKTTRGMVLQLQGWTADYVSQRQETHKRMLRRRTPSYSAVADDQSLRFTPPSPSRKPRQGPADGRRLAIHVRGLEGFVMESADFLEPESFLSVPRFEVALSTASDLQGPIFHVNSVIKSIDLKYSIYRYYSIGVAATVIRDAFFRRSSKEPLSTAGSHTRSMVHESLQVPDISSPRTELMVIDIKSSLIQIKCTMPQDPPMLLQVYGLSAGRHRWSAPFVRSELIRLHAQGPKLKGPWARILGINHLRVDVPETRHIQGEKVSFERSIDIHTDSIRLAVPHSMIMHRVFDNIINTVKALTQLNHRFKSGTNEYVLESEPKGPKRVAKVSLRSKALLFELEDDAFEWKLNRIHRLGLLEQKQRLAREEVYRMKAKKLEGLRPRYASSRFRTHSTNPRSQAPSERSRTSEDHRRRSKSLDSRGRARSSSRGRRSSVRYNPDRLSAFSDSSIVTAQDAWQKLQKHNARSWKVRINSALRFQNTAIRKMRELFAGSDEPPDDVEEDEPIVSLPNRPGLMTTYIRDLQLVIDKPSFPVNEYPQFLHKIGKGMPLDMQYNLLIPMSIRLDMGEARVNLRDYPLDLIHIPALHPGQPPRLPTWSLRTDVVIAEELRDQESSRHVMINVAPPSESTDGVPQPGFSIDVRRTVPPVKTYSDATFEVNTNLPTCFSWGMSYQPVIQDMMKIIEGFTKPEIDPSERVGFWDKIRLGFHSRVRVLWKGDGDVHLRLKGSRDPYVVTGFGAGFVMCWRKDVQWEIHAKDDPREFMTVTSGDYVLAIPDYSHHARHTYESVMLDGDTLSSTSSDSDAALFKKVIMKLSGNVRWVAGLVFDRNIGGDQRSFQFRPHYEVVLRNSKYLDSERLKNYDAYRGFRSDHIHLSVAVVAPVSRVWSVNNREASTNYNAVHLSPRYFTHFFSWWSLFSGVMSLPVRQGPLWPGLTKSSKKFGRHLGTVKYNLFLSPLFVAHIYKHKEIEDYAEDTVCATGLKVRLDSFMLDLHQRREQVNTMAKGTSKQTKTSMMRINRAQLDFISADCRAVSASIRGTSPKDLENVTDDIVSSFQQPTPAVDISRFTIPDQDLNWIDMDDFVELDWILPAESNPKTQILPLAFSPRFSYFRQTDHGDVGPDEPGYSLFGDEPTHYCVMSQDNDPRRVQMELIRERLAQLDTQIESHQQLLGEHELRVVRSGEDPTLRSQLDVLVRQGESLRRRRKFLLAGFRRLEQQLFEKDLPGEADPADAEHSGLPKASPDSESRNGDTEIDEGYASPVDQFISDFNNRFIIHNIQLKWNNSLRNTMLRYIHQVSQRRGFVYYMSQRAVKFILDIVEEQAKSKLRTTSSATRSPRSVSVTEPVAAEKDDENLVEDRIEQLLSDAKRFVNADDGSSGNCKCHPGSRERDETISPEFTAQNSYYLRLIAPQIQLQSEKNKKSVAIVTAKGMQLKVISIMDKRRVSDDVSGLVQRQFTLDMDSAQFFVTTQKSLANHVHLYSGNRYGNTPGSTWPPWVSLECLFDFSVDPPGFSRIIQKTSASLRYDKYNTLRLKYNERVGSAQQHRQVRCPVPNENRMDQISVEFSHVRAICDSMQYYSMYIIVLDLLLYSEPLEKVRNEKLDKIMLASDFSDLRGAPEMVSRLQHRIRQLEEIKNVFQIQSKYLDTQGWKDRMDLEKDLALCEDELFFIMKAITTAQRRTDERTISTSSGLLRWTLAASEIVWHLIKGKREPLVEFQLRNAAYERTDNIDGSNYNSIEVQHIYGLNLLPDATYPQIIIPYLDEQRRPPQNEDDKMLKVHWFMLEAIAGIPVLDNFEVNLYPLKVQLERELGKNLFEYIFPGIGSTAFENGGFSPFIIKNMAQIEVGESDGEEKLDASTPALSTASTSADDSQGLSTVRSVETRLKPTLTLTDDRNQSPAAASLKSKKSGVSGKGTVIGRQAASGERMRPLSRPATTRSLAMTKKSSTDSLRLVGRQASDKSLTSQSTTDGGNAEKHRKFNLVKSSTKTWGDKAADDLTQMMSRASNYMTLTHVKINDVVLCLSYKGKGEHNIEDLHDFVFRLPVLEYRNKTWSNLDLALRLKKDVIKALISHAPAILGNKFSRHRPTKQQQKHLRELASSSQVLSVADVTLNANAERSDAASSVASRSSASERSESPPRRSFTSTASPSPLARADSMGSDMQLRAPGTPKMGADASSRGSSINAENRQAGRNVIHSALARRLTSEREAPRQEQEEQEPRRRPRKRSLISLRRKFVGSAD